MTGMDRCPRCGWTQALTIQEVATRLGVSHQTIRNMLRRGEFPASIREKVPGGFRYLIPTEDVDAKLAGARATA